MFLKIQTIFHSDKNIYRDKLASRERKTDRERKSIALRVEYSDYDNVCCSANISRADIVVESKRAARTYRVFSAHQFNRMLWNLKRAVYWSSVHQAHTRSVFIKCYSMQITSLQNYCEFIKIFYKNEKILLLHGEKKDNWNGFHLLLVLFFFLSIVCSYKKKRKKKEFNWHRLTFALDWHRINEFWVVSRLKPYWQEFTSWFSRRENYFSFLKKRKWIKRSKKVHVIWVNEAKVSRSFRKFERKKIKIKIERHCHKLVCLPLRLCATISTRVNHTNHNNIPRERRRRNSRGRIESAYTVDEELP